MADDYMTHRVAVIRIRGTGGVIVQFSGARPEDTAIVVGSVADVTDARITVKALETQTRKSGWIKYNG